MNEGGIRTFCTREKWRLHLLLIAVTGFIAYCRVIGNGFVWDDTIYLTSRAAFRDFNLREIFTSAANSIEYLPVRDLTSALDFLIWGASPAGHHFTSLLIHLASAVIVYLLAEDLATPRHLPTDSRTTALVPLATALLFALHPLQSQSVSWVSGRNVILAGFFTLLATLLYSKHLATSRRAFYIGALAAFICALLSKATAIILPVLLCLALFHRPAGKKLLGHLLGLLPFIVTAAFFYYLHTSVAAKVKILNPEAGGSFAATVAKSLQIPWFYIGKFLYPLGFAPVYDVKFSYSLASPQVIGSFVGLVLLLIVVLWQRKANPMLSFGIAWYFIAIVPVLNFFGTTPIVADRYAYIPVLGLCLSVAAIADRIADRRGLLPVIGLLLPLVALLGFLSYGESLAWRSEETLWAHGVKNAPKNGKNYANLGVYYFNNREYAKAFPLFLKIRETDYPWDYYDYCSGRLHLERGELADAVKSLQGAIARNDRFDKPYLLLGTVYERLGDHEAAYISYSKGIPLRTDADWEERENAEKSRNRIMITISRELDEMRKKTAASPNDVRLQGELALKLDRLMFYDEALTEYRKLERLGMKGWQLYFNIGVVAMKLERYSEAEEAFTASISLNQRNKDAFNNLGLLLNNRKDYKKAIQAFRSALAIDPHFASAKRNLALAYYHDGNRSEAESLARDIVAEFPEMKTKLGLLLNPSR